MPFRCPRRPFYTRRPTCRTTGEPSVGYRKAWVTTTTPPLPVEPTDGRTDGKTGSNTYSTHGERFSNELVYKSKVPSSEFTTVLERTCIFPSMQSMANPSPSSPAQAPFSALLPPPIPTSSSFRRLPPISTYPPPQPKGLSPPSSFPLATYVHRTPPSLPVAQKRRFASGLVSVIFFFFLGLAFWAEEEGEVCP